MLVLTFGIGLGMGLAGPIFPLVVRHEMPARPALGTGAYAIGLVLGGTLAAALVVPLAGDGGDWRHALAVVTLAGVASLAVWLGLAPTDEVTDPTLAPPRIPWRSPVAWVLGVLFGLQSMLYYGVVTWLAAIYVDRGWSGPASASLVALFGGVTLVATTVMPLGADRIGSRRGQLVASSLLILVGLVGIVVAPDPAVVWAVAARPRDGRHLPDRPDPPGRRRRTTGRCRGDGRDDAARRLHPVGRGAARLRHRPRRDRRLRAGMGLLVGLGVVLVGLCAVLTPARLHRIGSAEADSRPNQPGEAR